ncbi:MAG: gamma-glutamylcyclotransferase [Legionella sp.]|uniref:gamma-glutamylcyclotransferase family protein n=1 Tax=Legionella sp. TaxID=459 RepID=UPI002848E106|nr:gamma-glutamylcyclotransferase [Legionella sp.]
MLYFAYGSNLNIEQMVKRCPDSMPIKRLKIDDFRLVFRGVADIEYQQGASVEGALWEISQADEDVLDRYEGVDLYLYSKEYFDYNGEEVLCYTMNENGIMPPNDYYAHVIRVGFNDFDIPHDTLDAALNESWAYKNPTRYLKKRRYRERNRGLKRARPIQKIAACG